MIISRQNNINKNNNDDDKVYSLTAKIYIFCYLLFLVMD